MRRLSPVSFFIVGVVLSGCVPNQELTLIEREQRRLRSASTRVSKNNTDLRNEVATVQASLADTRATLQELQGGLNALNEKVDEVRHQIDRQIGQSVRERAQKLSEMEVRIARIDDDLRAQGTLLRAREEALRVLRQAVIRATQGRAGFPGLGRSKSGTKTMKVGDGASGEPEGVRKDYEDARKVLERKDYRSAIEKFKKFILNHPKSNLADNAQYWVGESYYALRKFDRAIIEFDALGRKYPKGDKVPAALLKQGFAFAELGDKVDARHILQDLIDRYPKSQEAAMAKRKVKALGS